MNRDSREPEDIAKLGVNFRGGLNRLKHMLDVKENVDCSKFNSSSINSPGMQVIRIIMTR